MRDLIVSAFIIWVLSTVLFIASVTEDLNPKIQFVFGIHIIIGFGGVLSGALLTYLDKRKF